MAGSSDNKSLTFSSTVDTKGIKSLTGSLKDLKNVSDNLKKSFDSMSKSLSFDKQIKDLKSFKMAIDSALPSLNKYVAAIRLMSGNVGSSSVPGAPVGAVTTPGQMPGSRGGRSGGGGNSDGARQYTPNASGGFFSPPNSEKSKGLTMAGNIMASVGQAFGVYQSWKTEPLQNFATTQQFGGGILNRAYNGDISDGMALLRNKGAAGNRIGQSGGRWSIYGGQIANSAGEIVKGMASGNAGNFAGSLAKAGSSAIMGSSRARAEEASALNASLEATKAASPMESLLIQHNAASSRMRMDLSRTLQGKDQQATRIGAKNAYGPEETAAFYTAGANRFGASAIMGGGGGGGSGGRGTPWSSYSVNNHGDGLGGNAGQPATFYEQGQGGGGGGSGGGGGYVGIGQRALELSKYGYNKESTLNQLGQLQMGIGGDKNKAGDEAYKKLESVFRKAFAGGVVDAQLSEKIGQAVADNAFGGGGRSSSPESFGYAITGGLDKNSTAHDIDARARGADTIGQGASSIPIIRALVIETLKNQVGGLKGAQALADTSFPQLLAGGGEDIKHWYPKAADRKKAIYDTEDTWITGTVGLLAPPGSNVGDAIKYNGGGAKGLRKTLLTNHDAKVEIASMLKGTKHFGENLDDIMGGLDDYAHRDDKSWNKGPVGKDTTDAVARATEENKAQQKQQAAEGVIANAEKFINAIALQADIFEKIGSLEGTDDAAVNTMKALKELIITVQSDPATIKKIQVINDDLIKRQKGPG